MHFGAYEFRPRLIPTLATLCMMAITFSAGRWQLNRVSEKQASQSLFRQTQQLPAVNLAQPIADVDSLRYRALVAAGQFLPDKQIYIDNREHDGRSGYHVITPLAIDGTGDIVLVNRGWVERGRNYSVAPDVKVPNGSVRVTGTGSLPSKKFLELSDQAIAGKVWQNLTFERVNAILGLKVLPIIVLQQNDLTNGLSPVIEQPDFKINMHRGYAFQWFALTATLLVIYVVVNAKRTTA
jgi:surfeit locus 1 family protein